MCASRKKAVTILGVARALAREDTSAPIRDAEHAAGYAPTEALVEYVVLGGRGIFGRARLQQHESACHESGTSARLIMAPPRGRGWG
jgi:hypothetical protein